MDAFLFDTSVLSALLDPKHPYHAETQQWVNALDASAPRYVSVVGLAELSFGIKLAEAFKMGDLPTLMEINQQAQDYGVLDISKHTSDAYAELKANMAKKYLEGANRRDRPRWLENWVDKNTERRLQVDENDLWMCAQAKERGINFVTADKNTQRIADADPEVQLFII